MQLQQINSTIPFSIDTRSLKRSANAWLRLGRASTLPTVWANVFTGIALATSHSSPANVTTIIFAIVAMTLAYLSGTFLNDVFDLEFDKNQRNKRPIANGEIRLKSVAIIAFVFVLLSVSAMMFGAHSSGQPATQTLFSTLTLMGCIVLYNAWHKNNPISPIIMGSCRAMVYITCALLVSNSLPAPVLIAAALIGIYVIGLTYTDKQNQAEELRTVLPLFALSIPLGCAAYLAWYNPLATMPFLLLLASVLCAVYLMNSRRPGDVAMATIMLTSAMALLDSILLFAHGFPALAWAALGCWFLSTIIQTQVART